MLTTNLGMPYNTTRARPELLDQVRPGEHVWITNVTFVHPDHEKLRAAMHEREQLLLDGENIALVTVACFVCEQSWTDRVSYLRCTGEPDPNRRDDD